MADGRTSGFGRRRALAVLALAPLAMAGTARAACYDPAALARSIQARRRTLGFEETASDPAKRCGGCTFFTATQGDCGKCNLMTGGPVTAAGTCRSWAKKA